MNAKNYTVHPNAQTPVKGANRMAPGAPLRSGMIEENDDTTRMGIANQFAAVTREDEGFARVYIFRFSEDVSVWEGPHRLHSEEVS